MKEIVFILSALIVVSCSRVPTVRDIVQVGTIRGIQFDQVQSAQTEIQNKDPQGARKQLGAPAYEGSDATAYYLVYLNGQSRDRLLYNNDPNAMCYAIPFYRRNGMIFQGNYFMDVQCHSFRNRVTEQIFQP